MHLKELTIEEFQNFAKVHEYSNYHQTLNYAMLMSENGYDYDLIGYVDVDGNILAGSLILLKPIGIKCFYGFAPRGFLLDYANTSLVFDFTNELKKYYYEKNVIFIKINPLINVGEYNYQTKEIEHNDNYNIKDILNKNGYKKLKDNLYFEAMNPRFEAIIDLKRFNENDLDKNTKNKIKKGIRKGLVLEKVDKNNVNIFYDLIKDKLNKNEYYYQDYYTAFSRDNSIDLFLVSINYSEFLTNSQFMYERELKINNKLNEKLVNNNGNKVINAKMQSDKNLLSYKNDIMEATKYLNENVKNYIAGALVIKNNDTVSIVMSGFDVHNKRYSANYFMHYELIKYYQKDYKYLNIGGVTGDFKNNNDFTGLNRFKMGFKPRIIEYVGEYDLIVEAKSYQILLENGILAKEFNKK